MKYVFKQIDSYTPSETTVEFEADSLETILEQFEMFLKGSGYQISGTLDIVYPEEEINYDDINIDLSSYGQQSDDIVLNFGAAEPALDLNFETDTSVMAHIAADLLRQNEKQNGIKVDFGDYKVKFDSMDDNCPLCRLPKSVMQSHNCFDEKCPIR
jgi:hypothetical protein